jgi:hypothetical protein
VLVLVLVLVLDFGALEDVENEHEHEHEDDVNTTRGGRSCDLPPRDAEREDRPGSR